MAGPIDSSNLNGAVQRAVEQSYKRSYQHIADLQARVKSIERTERTYMVSIDNNTQFPPLHDGGLAFVQDEEAWYYCDGVAWIPVPGGATGGGKPYATFTIAAVDTKAPDRLNADYVCDGVDDQVEINAALALGPYIKIILLDGVFTISAPILIAKDYCVIHGMGMHETFIMPVSGYTGIALIDPTGPDQQGMANAVYGIDISELSLSGDYECDYLIASVTTTWLQHNTDYRYDYGGGIFVGFNFFHVAFWDANVAAIYGWNLTRSHITDCRLAPGEYGIFILDECDHCTIANNLFDYCTIGIHLTSGVYNTITGNVMECDTCIAFDADIYSIPENPDFGYGITDQVITGNLLYGWDYGVRLHGNSAITIESNKFVYGSDTVYIDLYNVYEVIVTGNLFGGNYAARGITIEDSEHVQISSNHFNNTVYEAILVTTSNAINIVGNGIWHCGMGDRSGSTWTGTCAQVRFESGARNFFANNGIFFTDSGTYDSPPVNNIILGASTSDCAVVFNDLRGGVVDVSVLDGGTNNTILLNLPIDLGQLGLSLDSLTDVIVTDPQDGDLLSYDSDTGTWVNAPAGTVSTPLDGLSDVDATAPNDGDMLAFNSGSGNWEATAPPAGGGSPWLPTLVTPVLGDFSWVTQGTATATEQYGGITLYEPGHSGTSARILKVATPTAPYTVTAAFIPSLWAAKTYLFNGICLRQSSNGSLQTLALLGQGGAPYWVSCDAWTSDTSYLTQYAAQSYVHVGTPMWLRIVNDNTNHLFYYSSDGFTWQLLHSISKTAFVVADQVGFFVDAWNTSTPDRDAAMHLVHWSIT